MLVLRQVFLDRPLHVIRRFVQIGSWQLANEMRRELQSRSPQFNDVLLDSQIASRLTRSDMNPSWTEVPYWPACRSTNCTDTGVGASTRGRPLQAAGSELSAGAQARLARSFVFTLANGLAKRCRLPDVQIVT